MDSLGRGTIRTGLHGRPAAVEYRPEFDLDKTRVRLIESGIYEMGRALSASVDELLTAMCQAVERLEQPDTDELYACPQCNRLGEWTIGCTTGQKFCSRACSRHFRAEAD